MKYTHMFAVLEHLAGSRRLWSQEITHLHFKHSCSPVTASSPAVPVLITCWQPLCYLPFVTRLPKGEHLLVDAPELIERFLTQEQVRGQ